MCQARCRVVRTRCCLSSSFVASLPPAGEAVRDLLAQADGATAAKLLHSFVDQAATDGGPGASTFWGDVDPLEERVGASRITYFARERQDDVARFALLLVSAEALADDTYTDPRLAQPDAG